MVWSDDGLLTRPYIFVTISTEIVFSWSEDKYCTLNAAFVSAFALLYVTRRLPSATPHTIPQLPHIHQPTLIPFCCTQRAQSASTDCVYKCVLCCFCVTLCADFGKIDACYCLGTAGPNSRSPSTASGGDTLKCGPIWWWAISSGCYLHGKSIKKTVYIERASERRNETITLVFAAGELISICVALCFGCVRLKGIQFTLILTIKQISAIWRTLICIFGRSIRCALFI